jgi:hypothetical protein
MKNPVAAPPSAPIKTIDGIRDRFMPSSVDKPSTVYGV